MRPPDFQQGDVQLWQGDCLELRKVAAMFVKMLLSSHCLKILNSIIQRIAIPMVDNQSWLQRSVLRFPIYNSAEFPNPRITHLYECSLCAALCSTNANGSDRHDSIRLTALLEFACRRQMNSFFAKIPRDAIFRKFIGGGFSGTIFIPNHSLAYDRWEPSLCVPYTTALSGAESCSFLPIGFD